MSKRKMSRPRKRPLAPLSKLRTLDRSAADLPRWPISDVPHLKHCDEYIDDQAQPPELRRFLDWARSPGHGLLLPEPHPRLFADYKGRRIRVTMASRLGDVGITHDLTAERGYESRVPVADLAEFSDEPGSDADPDARFR